MWVSLLYEQVWSSCAFYYVWARLSFVNMQYTRRNNLCTAHLLAMNKVRECGPHFRGLCLNKTKLINEWIVIFSMSFLSDIIFWYLFRFVSFSFMGVIIIIGKQISWTQNHSMHFYYVFFFYILIHIMYALLLVWYVCVSCLYYNLNTPPPQNE